MTWRTSRCVAGASTVNRSLSTWCRSRPEGDSPKAQEYRELEAEVLARYLRWLVERSDVEVLDPVTRERRAVTYADVAVLVLETTNVHLLFPRLDELGVPHSARGGTLLFMYGLHGLFLVGLGGIAYRDDGVAQAALHRPPFFSIDVSDLVKDTAAARAAKEIILDLRTRRLARAPGATARDLLERTGFARAIAVGPNGAQRLERLYEICLTLEITAERDGLDYDGVTARMRRCGRRAHPDGCAASGGVRRRADHDRPSGEGPRVPGRRAMGRPSGHGRAR